MDTSTDSVLDRYEPQWGFYQKSLKLFGGDEVVVVALRAPEPYDSETLARVHQVSRDLRSVEGIRRVDSIATMPLIDARPDGSLRLDPPIAGAETMESIDRARLAQQLANDRIAPRILVSEDGTLFAINALLAENVDGRFEAIVDAIQRKVPEGALVSGVPVFRTAINTKTASEIGVFVGLTVLAISALLYSIFGSLLAVVIPLSTAGVGSLSLLAAMGFAGEPLSLTTMVLPSIMVAIGCANVMHVITEGAGISDRSELERALDPVILPVLMSGLTTTIGFLAVSGVPIDAVRATGAYGAVGVIVVLAATLTAVPAALAIWPLKKSPMRLSNWIREVVCPIVCRIALNNRSTVLMVATLVAVIAAFGVGQLKVETDATTWFPEKSSIRSSYEEIRASLSGISPMNVVIESTEGMPVTEPEILRAIDRLARYLESLPAVGRAVSLADPLIQLNQGFSGGDRSLPESREAAEQYLLLLESYEQIRDLVTGDRAHANVMLRVNNNGSEDLQRVAKDAEEWWRAHGPKGTSATATGVMFEFARAEDKIAMGQVRGMLFALVAIGAVLVSFFRQPWLALATIITNAAPILVSFGAMGFLRQPLDAGTVVVGNLAIGVAIDETLHLASGLRNLRGAGGLRRRMLKDALDLCVPSIVYTTAAIAVGFGILGLSDFSFTRDLGLMTAGIMVLCIIADLLLLPALVLAPQKGDVELRDDGRSAIGR